MPAILIPFASVIAVAGASLLLALASWWATGLVRQRLIARNVLDRPNERSSHSIPAPRGGGIAVIGVAAPAMLAAGLTVGSPTFTLLAMVGSCVILAIVGFRDDVKALPVAPRLLCQAGAVGVTLWALLIPNQLNLNSGWLAAVSVVLAIGWMWFINLYNFMDGIDGITAVETITICAGTAVIDLIHGPGWLWPLAFLLGGAILGFAVWNWAPAKIFLGDVGSVPLGFVLGALLLALALSGNWAAALVLPAYYLVDASLTMTKRLLIGKKSWEAHREHFYQKATQSGLGHDAVSLRIGVLNVILVACAILASYGRIVEAFAISAFCVATLLVSFADRKR